MNKFKVLRNFPEDSISTYVRPLYFECESIEDCINTIYADWLSNEQEPDESQYMDDPIFIGPHHECHIYSGEGELECTFLITKI